MMLYGKQKIELSYQSVREALADYLAKHFAPGVVVEISAWETVSPPTGSYGAAPELITVIHFNQAEQKG